MSIEHTIRSPTGDLKTVTLTRKTAIAGYCNECMGYEEDPIECTDNTCCLFPFRGETPIPYEKYRTISKPILSEQRPRYQTDLTLSDISPEREDTLCRCGCGREISNTIQGWHSIECIEESIQKLLLQKGTVKVIRDSLFKRDMGICSRCKTAPHQRKDPRWEAHHIIPVSKGGSGCDINGFQTLCINCHIDHHKQKEI